MRERLRTLAAMANAAASLTSQSRPVDPSDTAGIRTLGSRESHDLTTETGRVLCRYVRVCDGGGGRRPLDMVFCVRKPAVAGAY